MVFRRRDRRPILTYLGELFFPRGGWKRATQYVIHRVRRLPDPPHRIARGVFAGVFISFTPLFGFHFLLAAAIAWVIRGNILAALLATFIGNPITTPLIAYGSVEFGHFLLGSHSALTFEQILDAFGGATHEIWRNVMAMFTPEVAHWKDLGHFMRTIFIPYMTGGVILGTIVGLICHYLTLPIVTAYKGRRKKKLHDRMLKLRAKAEARAKAREAAAQGAGLEHRDIPG